MKEVPIRFHTVHGSGVEVSEHGLVASRAYSHCNGLVFSDRPMKYGQRLTLELSQSAEFCGALRLGVTSHNPETFRTSDGDVTLPAYACPELTSKPGYWATPLPEQYARIGNRITVCLTEEGSLQCYVNCEYLGALLIALPVTGENKNGGRCDFWLMLDLFGNTTRVRLVSTEHLPKEIVARGAEAIAAYQRACSLGTRQLYRTRLMLVGAQGAGKTMLKRVLLGLRSDHEAEVIEGIDLSTSCSFSNDSQQSGWTFPVSEGQASNGVQRLDEKEDSTAEKEDLHLDLGALRAESEAVSRQEGWEDPSSGEPPESRVINTYRHADDILIEEPVSRLEREYHKALAENIVQELLHRRNQRQSAQQAKNSSHKATSSPERHTNKQATEKTDKPSSALIDTSVQGSTASDKTPALSSQTSTKASLESIHGYQDLLQDMPKQVVEIVEARLHTVNTGSLRATSGQQVKGQCAGQTVQLDIWDFAGHSVYQSIYQVFLTRRAVYVIVFNLCDEMEGLPRDESDSTHPMGQSSSASIKLTTLEVIDRWLNSIHSHASSNARATDDVSSQTLAPPVAIVGTHRNSVHPDSKLRDEIVNAKLSRLREFINTRHYAPHVVPTFYAIDSHPDHTDPELEKLRGQIESVVCGESYMGEAIPLKWLQFECRVAQLAKEDTYYSTVAQIQEVARDVGIHDNEGLRAMLEFYHDLGVLVYFGADDISTSDVTLLPQTVVLQPAWLINMMSKAITAKDPKMPTGLEDAWRRLKQTGALDDRLLDGLWEGAHHHKRALINIMDKCDLLARPPCSSSWNASLTRNSGFPCFFVPACIRAPEGVTYPPLYHPASNDVTFYYDFHGFLPDALWHSLVVRCVRWSLSTGGHDPQIRFRQARFFVDAYHDLLLQAHTPRLNTIKVVVLRVVSSADDDGSIISETDSGKQRPSSAPSPVTCAKVRRLLETSLLSLRSRWFRRLHYEACVRCPCNRPCVLHQTNQCAHAQCFHYLNLDDCIANKIVCCEHRRIQTAPFRRWFPSPLSSKCPVLLENSVISKNGGKSTEGECVPTWIRSAAKLLSCGGVEDGQDWVTLAKLLGYKSNKMEEFGQEYNPALALMTDWILASGNSTLSLDMLTSLLETCGRHDVADVITKGQEESLEPAQVFLSYDWELQDEVSLLRERLEAAGLSCWMDIGQLGAGDQLYAKIDQGMRHAKVVIACISPRYCVSHYCQREAHLADLLHKPVLPVVFQPVPWPPPGPLSLVFAQLVYVNMKGVGGHGGAGLHADIEDKYQSIIQRLLPYCTPSPQKQISVDTNSLSNHERQSFSRQFSEESGRNSRSAQLVTLPFRSLVTSPSTHMVSESSALLREDGVWRRRNTSAQRRGSGSRREPVNVSNCAVCTVL